MGAEGLKRLLVIEDDLATRTLLAATLRGAGYDVEVAGDGPSAVEAVERQSFSLVLLDLGLPGLDGSAVLSRIRSTSHVPVIVLSARSRDVEKARMLLAGADDYVAKPFSRIELLARIEARLRTIAAPELEVSRLLCDGPLRVDVVAHQAWLDGAEVELSRTEFGFLVKLMREPGRAIPFAELLRDVWLDPSGIGTDRVKFMALRLRRKLGADLAGRLEPVRGVGYRWAVVNEPSDARAVPVE
jgi:DNA-binding response OmpR family regulator